MKQSDDIANLFQQFGAEAGPYHELARQQEHSASSQRWPLLAAVRGADVNEVPSVGRRAGTAMAQAVTPAQAPAPMWSTAQGVQDVGALAAMHPRQVEVQASAPQPAPAVNVPAPAAGHGLLPSALVSRSPLAGLAGLRAQPASSSAEALVHPPELWPVDLSSVFFRLGAAASVDGAARTPTPAWQPRKGPI